MNGGICIKFGIYLRKLEGWNQIQSSVSSMISAVVCGDYGCPKVLPSVKELIGFKTELLPSNIDVHYISPKITQAMLAVEEPRILSIIESGISVSINDWGLLYRLKEKIRPDHDIYLGRLLTKSIADWTWSNLFFEKENVAAIDYLSQNNFNHDLKIEYFKKWGIKGIEVNVHRRGETSYAYIQKQGFAIIGYADKSIAAVSRVCPYLKMEGMDYTSGDCTNLCTEESFLYPSDEKAQSVYPGMELHGNVIYINNQDEPLWKGYDKLIYMSLPS